MSKWKSLLILPLFSLGLFSVCNQHQKIDQAKNDILQTEQSFARLAAGSGVKTAFLTYAAKDAVLHRNNTIFQGLEEIENYFESQSAHHIQLCWTPDFVDVSQSCDLGYTYGHYTISAVEDSGEKIESKGIFHTVWKKQPDGKWKFVYD